MTQLEQQSSFFCHCCERDLDDHLRSKRVLVTNQKTQSPLCKQCDGFIKIQLPHVMGRLAKKKLTVALAAELTISTTPGDTPERSRPTPSPPSESDGMESEQQPHTQKKELRKARRASATECDAFSHRSLAVTRYIEGFIQGLEAAGMNRDELESSATSAINILLGFCQKLSSERLNVLSGRVSRSEVRRLTRHIQETSLMVDEYVNAIRDIYRSRRSNRPRP